MAKNEAKPSKDADKYNIRRWSVPSKRAKGYAEDRKAKVHTYGPKEGKELTDYEAGMRSGYLQAQSDHAGIYKYNGGNFVRVYSVRLSAVFFVVCEIERKRIRFIR